MYTRYYTLLSHWFFAHPRALKCLRATDEYLVKIFVVLYIVLVLDALIFPEHIPGVSEGVRAGRIVLIKIVVIPALTLGISRLIRRFIQVERPRVRYHIRPLIPHHDTTTAFPSKHAASACAIMWAWVFWWGFGIPALIVVILTLAVGLTRIVGGAHMPRDVLAGYALASLLALLYLI